MNTVKIYHNSSCSKSRAALETLEKSNITFQIIEYLKTPPTELVLDSLLTQLKMNPEQLVRKGEDEYEALKQKKLLPQNRAEWIQILVKHPILIERPIVSDGQSAVIGRPTEKITEWLSSRRTK